MGAPEARPASDQPDPSVPGRCSRPAASLGSKRHARYEVLRDQTIAPHNMPLWHKNYFELKTLDKRQMPKKPSALPHYLPKHRTQIPVSKGVSPSCAGKRKAALRL